jgi:hypothetical protein
MKAWSEFLRDVRPLAASTPEPVAEHALRRAAQAFCQATRAWKVELDPTRTREGVREYDLELDSNTELVRIESATLNGNDYSVWRTGDHPRGRYVYTPDGKTVLFADPVAAGLPLVLTCSVKPGNNATGVDDAIFDRYVDVIALGAVARLTGDGNKRLDFEDQCDRIKTRLWRGEAAIRPRTRASFF